MVPVVIGVTLLALFTIQELRFNGEPAIDLRLFRDRSFSVSSGLLLLSGLALYGALLLLTLYYQSLLGDTALVAGLLLAPQGIGSLLTRWTGKLTDRLGARPIVIGGLAAAAVGTFPFTQAGLHANVWLLDISLAVRGGGLGAATIGLMSAAYQEIRIDLVPHASSATRILAQVGGAFGTAVLAVILAHQMFSRASAAAAFDAAFWWAFGFTLISLVLAILLLPRFGSVAQRAG